MTNSSIQNVSTTLAFRDCLGILKMRLGIGRGSYKIEPGIYSVGSPDSMSPVLVTSNYKMTFDVLRSELTGLNAWVLVIDTRGINVWCSAGKGTFSAEEIARMITVTDLAKIVDHRVLILPQLSAPGVAAHEVRRATGFKVVYGPVRAGDLKRFIYNDNIADEGMRTVGFGFRERIVLIPLEIMSRVRTSVLAIIGIFIISLPSAWSKGCWGVAAYLAGFFTGAVAVPALLPWLPGRAFSLKGGIAGAAAGVLVALAASSHLNLAGLAATVLFAATAASYIALHFTGASTFTSPSGVEKEMRRAIPIQAIAVLICIITWVFFARVS